MLCPRPFTSDSELFGFRFRGQRRRSRVEYVPSGSLRSRKQKVVKEPDTIAPASPPKYAPASPAKFASAPPQKPAPALPIRSALEDLRKALALAQSDPKLTPAQRQENFDRYLKESMALSFKMVKEARMQKDFDPVALGLAPRRKEPSQEAMDAQDLSFAQKGISFLNDPANLDPGVGEYEVVKPGLSTYALFSHFLVGHANFEAKPKNNPDAEPTLFFVELRNGDVSMCRALGPSGSASAATGPNGCRMCLSRIHHPGSLDFHTAR